MKDSFYTSKICSDQRSVVTEGVRDLSKEIQMCENVFDTFVNFAEGMEDLFN